MCTDLKLISSWRTRSITSPTYISSFLASRYLSKNFPNFFKVDTEVGLFKAFEYFWKPQARWTCENVTKCLTAKSYENVTKCPTQRENFRTLAYLFLKLALMSSMPLLALNTSFASFRSTSEVITSLKMFMCNITSLLIIGAEHGDMF